MTSFTITEIIAWITVFLLIAAIPLTIFYFRHLNRKNSDSLLSKMQKKTPAPKQKEVQDLNFNFDNNWSSESVSDEYIVNSGTEKKLAKIILKTIALNGESGMLIKQISDILELHEIEVNYALSYLEDKSFIESVNSQKGNIYYLTSQGTSYCSKKGFLSEVA
jgi:predicted transcriptional regulator